MKNKIIYTIFFVFSFSIALWAKQETYIKHTVSEGETIAVIAQKYKVTPFDIYKINPDSQYGIKTSSVLLIPSSTAFNSSVSKVEKFTKKVVDEVSKQTPKENPINHVVQPKETLFGIARQYNVSVEAIKAINGDLLKNGLQVGQSIKIPSSTNSEKTSIAPKETPKTVAKEEIKTAKAKEDHASYHIIQPKETKYAVSKKYGMTIEELERLNPEIKSNFPVGQKIVVSGNAVSNGTARMSSEEGSKSKRSNGKRYFEEYVVKPKETIASIAKDYGITEDDLVSLNPELKKGIKLGMILRVPKGQRKASVKKEHTNLYQTINTNASKKLALLLPFNLAKIESDTANSTQSRLKKDKFLNLTLDFYAGALMAIDSAKVLGLNIEVTILDSQETKNSSNIEQLTQVYQLKTMDAVIGPFYQTNVEKLASVLESSNTPVISPLSKEIGNKYSNLFQSMPSSDAMRSAVLEYMETKNGNIIAVVDPKKSSVKQYLHDAQSDINFLGFSAKGTVVADSLRVSLKKDRLNYVLLASESTNMILATLNAMLSVQKEYQMQLVILEPNETFDFEEIPLEKLTKLKLLYPSMSRPNDTEEANQFDEKFKKANKILPNRYAVRGFDLTFDTLMRLSQEETFEETVQTIKTEQIESKFDYVQNPTYGYSNNGVYVLYYDTDLTIKEAQ